MNDLREIVPEKFINDIAYREIIPTKKFLKYRLFSKLLKDIDRLCNEAKLVSLETLNDELQLLINKDILKPFSYDEECIKYNLTVLNLEKILKILNNLYYTDIFFTFFVLKILSPYYRLLRPKKEITDIESKISKVIEIDTFLKSICNSKGLSDYYDTKYGKKIESLEILEIYIKKLLSS